jgi:hypothetical protein
VIAEDPAEEPVADRKHSEPQTDGKPEKPRVRSTGWDDWTGLEEGADETDWTMPILTEEEQRFNEEALALAAAQTAQQFGLVREMTLQP